jgi:hypothetical protein
LLRNTECVLSKIKEYFGKHTWPPRLPLCGSHPSLKRRGLVCKNFMFVMNP